MSSKYRLLERLGGGGMGEVYRAEHTLAGRTVALKLLRAELAENDDLTRRFFQEAQAVNRIQHPNIVDVLDAGFSEFGPYVVMECLEGRSVGAVLAAMKRLEAPAALAVLLPVLDALDAAHRLGIIHRDLKPENVFLASIGGDVRVKILDFGVAKMEGTDGALRPHTHTGVVFGTPDYLSPEQASGEGVIDGRSDVFSAGTLLFELLTGQRPFEAKSAVATAYRIVHEPAPRLAALGVRGDPVLQAALDVALAKRVDERFATAAAFVDMLGPILPDGATRRAALRALLDAALARFPTAAQSAAEPPSAQPFQAGPPAVAAPLAQTPPPAPLAPRSPPQGNPAHDASGPAVLPTLLSGDLPAQLRAAQPESPVPPSPARPLEARARSAESGERLVGAAPAPSTPEVARAPKRDFGPLSRPSPGTDPRPSPTALPLRPRMDSSAHGEPSRPHSTHGEGAKSSGGMSAAPPTTSRGRAMATPPWGTTAWPTRTPAWEPRPLPGGIAGRCHARGSFPRAAAKWIDRVHGHARLADVLALLPPAQAEPFRSDGLNALAWYDLELVHVFMEAAAFTALGGNLQAWRDLAREHCERDLGPMLRPAARLTDPEQLLKRSASAWGRLFDFGAVKVSDAAAKPGGGVRVSVRADGYDPTSLAMRYAIAGTLEGLVRSTGAREVTSRFLAGEASFTPDLELELTWRE